MGDGAGASFTITLIKTPREQSQKPLQQRAARLTLGRTYCLIAIGVTLTQHQPDTAVNAPPMRRTAPPDESDDCIVKESTF